MNALTKSGNGAEKPPSQLARNVAQRSLLKRTLLFAGVFALLAMVFVPTPARQYQSAHYRFIFDQHETGIAFFQLLANVAFAALAGVLLAHAFRAIAKIPKRVIVVAGILAVVAGFALTVNYYRIKADSERQQGLYLYAAADYDHALFFGDLAGQCRREQAQIEQGQIEQAQRMERARLHTGVNVFDQFDPPAPPKTSPIPDWAKSASKKSDDAQEKKQKRSAAVPSPATAQKPTPH